VLWKAGFAGLKWDSQDSHIVQESETGQVALNLRRHRGLLNLGRKLFEDDEFVKQIVYGDKDIFRFMFLLARMPYFFVPELYGYAVLNRYGLGKIKKHFPLTVLNSEDVTCVNQILSSIRLTRTFEYSMALAT
jgi:hypothetical protein